jgi:hypothetical protein
MKRAATIALSSVLAISIASFDAFGGEKNPSAPRSGAPPSKDRRQEKSTDKGQWNAKDKGKDGGWNTTHQVNTRKGSPFPTLPPMNPGSKGKKPGPPTQHLEALKNVGKNPSVGPGAQSAINTAVSGEFLSSTDRQNLNELMADNPARLGEDDLKAVQAALDYDALAKREERYIKLENATGERLTVWLHYQSFDEKQEMAWFPTRPVDPDSARRYILESGDAVYLSDHGVRVAAARARVWAESDSGHKWLAYRDRDLALKPSDTQALSEMGTRRLRLVGDNAKTDQASN